MAVLPKPRPNAAPPIAASIEKMVVVVISTQTLSRASPQANPAAKASDKITSIGLPPVFRAPTPERLAQTWGSFLRTNNVTLELCTYALRPIRRKWPRRFAIAVAREGDVQAHQIGDVVDKRAETLRHRDAMMKSVL